MNHPPPAGIEPGNSWQLGPRTFVQIRVVGEPLTSKHVERLRRYVELLGEVVAEDEAANLASEPLP